MFRTGVPSLTGAEPRILASFSAAFRPPQHEDLVISATSLTCSCNVRLAFASIPPPSGSSMSLANSPYSSLVVSSTARRPLCPPCPPLAWPTLDTGARTLLLCLASLPAMTRVAAVWVCVVPPVARWWFRFTFAGSSSREARCRL